MAKASISYPDELDDLIEHQVDRGVSESKSEWFREAAAARLDHQRELVETHADDEEMFESLLDKFFGPVEGMEVNDV